MLTTNINAQTNANAVFFQTCVIKLISNILAVCVDV